MARKAELAEPLDEYARESNRARFLEEASHGILRLLRQSNHNQAWLARRLDCKPSQISKILEGSHNFTMETLADVALALDRASHLVWGPADEMRLPIDVREVESAIAVNNVASGRGVVARFVRQVDGGTRVAWRGAEYAEGLIGRVYSSDYSGVAGVSVEELGGEQKYG